MRRDKLPILFSYSFWAIVFIIISTVCLFVPSKFTELSMTTPEQIGQNPILAAWHNNWPYRLIIIGGTCIVVLMVMIFKKIYKENQRKISEQIYDIKELTAKIKNEFDGADEKAQQYEHLNRIYTEYFQTLDSLSSEYFEKNDAGPQVRMSIIRKLEDELAKMQTEDFDKSLIDWVNFRYDGFMTQLQSKVAGLKPHEIKLICLKIAQFSPRAISLILQINISNYYNRWARVRLKIEKSEETINAKFLNLTLSNKNYN